MSTREVGKIYQDEIYGTQELSPLAAAIIDTPEFQRLDGLKQLGYTNRVFRCANHTRFQHSVGAHLLSKMIMTQITKNHERLGLVHPGRYVSKSYRIMPQNAEIANQFTSNQSRWRGVTEVVSIAALLHDLGHVPYGHTLEDEFPGVFPRHDRLAGPRLYQMMFHPMSELADVFSDALDNWIPGIGNADLRRLIYVILNWKEQLWKDGGDRASFEDLLAKERNATSDSKHQSRIDELKTWYLDVSKRGLFHPFMADIIGNTICVDLLDYLTRDRQNLGVKPDDYSRLHKYFTIRPGTYDNNDGLRMSIMVTRKGRGGQRIDVMTTILDIMHRRYEMPQAVYYHHKKCAASTMLAALASMAKKAGRLPRDDSDVYPAPWNQEHMGGKDVIPHMVHLNDHELEEYLSTIPLESDADRSLQHRLYIGLKYKRKDMYRTLLVLDNGLARKSGKYGHQNSAKAFANLWRESASRREDFEADLANAAGVDPSNVLIYCPSPDMQSKEVDVRVEISENKVIPLRELVLEDNFAYKKEIELLQDYYKELWRAYIFVSPSVYSSEEQCRLIIDRLCAKVVIEPQDAYRKARGLDRSLQAERAEGGSEALNESAVELVWRRYQEESDDEDAAAAIGSNADTNIIDLTRLNRITSEELRKRTRVTKKDTTVEGPDQPTLPTG